MRKYVLISHEISYLADLFVREILEKWKSVLAQKAKTDFRIRLSQKFSFVNF